MKSTELEKKLEELSETQEAVRSIYMSVKYDYEYQLDNLNRYKTAIKEATDDVDIANNKKWADACEFRLEIYEKIFDYLSKIMQGKA